MIDYSRKMLPRFSEGNHTVRHIRSVLDMQKTVINDDSKIEERFNVKRSSLEDIADASYLKLYTRNAINWKSIDEISRESNE